MKSLNVQTLINADNDAPLSNYTFSTNVTTEAIEAERSEGVEAVEVRDLSGGLDIDIKQQVSNNGTDWYDPQYFDGTSNNDSLKTVGTGITASGYFRFTPVPAKYRRFVITVNSGGVATILAVASESLN